MKIRSESIIYRIYELKLKLHKIGSSVVESRTVLKDTDFPTLRLISEYPDFNIQQIANFLSIEISKVKQSLSRLLAMGIIVYEMDFYTLQLEHPKITEKGKQVLRTALDSLAPVTEKIVSALNYDEQQQLISLLDRLIDNIPLESSFQEII